MKRMIRSVLKMNSSLYINVPALVSKDMGLSEKDNVIVGFNDGKIIIEKLKERYDI